MAPGAGCFLRQLFPEGSSKPCSDLAFCDATVLKLQKAPCRSCGREASFKESVDSDLGDLYLDLMAELIRLNDTVDDSLVDNDLA